MNVYPAKYDSRAETHSLLLEAYEYIEISETSKMDLSESWKINSIGACDPEHHDQWNKDRLWMLDVFDGMLGDDAMPAKCCACDSIYWGEDMMSVRNAVNRLRHKNTQSLTYPFFRNLWDEAEPNIIAKLRQNRFCKKCFRASLILNRNSYTWVGGSITSDQTSLFSYNNLSNIDMTTSGMVQPDDI